MHILFISSWYPTAEDPTLGIFNRYFARAASLYNKITVLNFTSVTEGTAEGISVDSSEEILSVQVNYKKVQTGFPVVSQLMKRSRLLAAFDKGYEKVLELAGRPQLIHLNVAMPMGIGVLHLARKYGLPYVVNENWSGYCREDGSYRGLAQTWYTQRIISGAKCIMPTSAYLRDAMLSHGLIGNYRVVPNVVDVERFRPVQQAKHEGTRFIHISSLNDREKNVSGLIRAFARALSADSGLQLDIVGEGSDRKKYEALVARLGLEPKVNFRGPLYGDELVQAINEADALAMFSHFETFCLVIIEGFACGKPVISSAAGAIPTYMNPSLGTVTPVGNEQALAKAMLEFSKQKHRYHTGTIRQYAVENYSYQKIGKDLDTIYHAALNSEVKID